jgi:hypothetical protein
MSFKDTMKCVAPNLFIIWREKRAREMPPKEVPQKKGKRQVQGTGRAAAAAAPAKLAKKGKVANPLFQAKPKNWRIGGDLRVRRGLLSL